MKIGICDDNEIYLNYLYTMAKKIYSNDSDIKIYKLSPEELYMQINKSINLFPYDILITDIDLGQLNGINLVKKINEINPSCIIIFVSNHLSFATEVYDVQHIYFVLKSDAELRLPKALTKAFTLYNENISKHLTITYQGIQHIITLSDILYIEALGRYLYIHKYKQSIKCINSLKTIASLLSDSFIRCHNSYIINANFIHSLSRNCCTLTSDTVIPISNTYLKSFNEAYVKYVSKKL